MVMSLLGSMAVNFVRGVTPTTVAICMLAVTPLSTWKLITMNARNWNCRVVLYGPLATATSLGGNRA